MDTTSQNVATNTPGTIARKRGVEVFLLSLLASAFVTVAPQLLAELNRCSAAQTPGTPCVFAWVPILYGFLAALVTALLVSAKAYMSATSNVAANAAQPPAPTAIPVAATVLEPSPWRNGGGSIPIPQQQLDPTPDPGKAL